MSNTMDISGLASKLRSDVISVIRSQVLKVCEEALRRNVMATIYAGKTPTMYHRTNDFLNAVDIMNLSISGNNASFDITINPSKMGIIPAEKGAPKNGRWGSHSGFSGQDFREGLIGVLDEGGGSEYYVHSGGHFFEKTNRDLEREIVPTMVSALRSMGWNATIG